MSQKQQKRGGAVLVMLTIAPVRGDDVRSTLIDAAEWGVLMAGLSGAEAAPLRAKLEALQRGDAPSQARGQS